MPTLMEEMRDLRKSLGLEGVVVVVLKGLGESLVVGGKMVSGGLLHGRYGAHGWMERWAWEGDGRIFRCTVEALERPYIRH